MRNFYGVISKTSRENVCAKMCPKFGHLRSTAFVSHWKRKINSMMAISNHWTLAEVVLWKKIKSAAFMLPGKEHLITSLKKNEKFEITHLRSYLYY